MAFKQRGCGFRAVAIAIAPGAFLAISAPQNGRFKVSTRMNGN